MFFNADRLDALDPLPVRSEAEPHSSSRQLSREELFEKVLGWMPVSSMDSPVKLANEFLPKSSSSFRVKSSRAHSNSLGPTRTGTGSTRPTSSSAFCSTPNSFASCRESPYPFPWCSGLAGFFRIQHGNPLFRRDVLGYSTVYTGVFSAIKQYTVCTTAVPITGRTGLRFPRTAGSPLTARVLTLEGIQVSGAQFGKEYITVVL
jgi:hypothetical protein